MNSNFSGDRSLIGQNIIPVLGWLSIKGIAFWILTAAQKESHSALSQNQGNLTQFWLNIMNLSSLRNNEIPRLLSQRGMIGKMWIFWQIRYNQNNGSQQIITVDPRDFGPPGSGSISHRYGSRSAPDSDPSIFFFSQRHGSAETDPDPDPHQNVMDQTTVNVYHWRRLAMHLILTVS